MHALALFVAAYLLLVAATAYVGSLRHHCGRGGDECREGTVWSQAHCNGVECGHMHMYACI